MQRGFTLLEVLISTAILAVIITTVMETLVASNAVYTQSDTEFGLELEARKVFRKLQHDLGNSTWYLPMTPIEKFDLLDPDLDREIRYYPYVFTQTSNGEGQLFKHLERSDSVDDASFAALGLNVTNEHRFASRELVFVKISRTQDVDNVRDTVLRPVSFDNTPTVPFDEYWDGPLLEEMWLSLEDNLIVAVNLSLEQNTSLELREYTYGVRYDPASKSHQLCKYYVERVDNGQGSTGADLVFYETVSNRVDRIVFDTYRTDFSLEVDQIRVQLWLSKRTNDGETIMHRASATFAMRSNVDPEYNEQIDSWLGSAGSFPVNP